MNDLIEKAKALLFRRQKAYQEYFDSPGGKELLADLARFCRAHDSTFHENTHVAARLDGRREVWLRIQQHLHLDPDTLWSFVNERKKP